MGAIGGDAPAKYAKYDVVHDVQAQTATAVSEFGGEERGEYARQYVGCNACAIVGYVQDDLLTILRLFRINLNPPGTSAVEAVNDGVVDQIGYDLTQRSGEAVHGQIINDALFEDVGCHACGYLPAVRHPLC